MLAGDVVILVKNPSTVLADYSAGFLDKAVALAAASMVAAYAWYTLAAETALIHGTGSFAATLPWVLLGTGRYLYRLRLRGEFVDARDPLLELGGGRLDPAETVVGAVPEVSGQQIETSTQPMVSGTPWAVPDDQTGEVLADLGETDGIVGGCAVLGIEQPA